MCRVTRITRLIDAGGGGKASSHRFTGHALFISAVSAEHRSLRGTVATLLDHEGYDTDFQEVLGTEDGDICGVLARHVNGCDGVIQIVGQRYGFAPPAPHPWFGECSYTQFEALYARSIGKPVRYILLDPAHPSDAITNHLPPESPEQQALQAAYRQRIQADTALHHPSTSLAETVALSWHGWAMTQNKLADNFLSSSPCRGAKLVQQAILRLAWGFDS